MTTEKSASVKNVQKIRLEEGNDRHPHRKTCDDVSLSTIHTKTLTNWKYSEVDNKSMGS